MSNIPHTVHMSLFGYFGKAGGNEKLPDPQGSLARDLLLSVMSSTSIDVHMTPMHHRLSAEPFFVIPTHVHMICSLEVLTLESHFKSGKCQGLHLLTMQYLVATTRNSYNIPTNDAGTSIYSENYAQHRPLKW